MKKVFIVIICTLLRIITSAQPVANSAVPIIDERVELLSIACKLADISGFSDTLNPVYSKAINEHFTRYSNHSLIKYITGIKDELDTAYWEIPGLAIHLSQPPQLSPLISYSDTAQVDMWEDRTLFTEQLILLIQLFYTDADCNTFFKSQQSYYQAVNKQYEKQGIQINTGWVKNFFGLATTENYYAVLALCLSNGAYLRVNYANNQRDTYTIFGCSSFDEKGIPDNFSDPVFRQSVLHEYIHAFTNQLIDKNGAQLQQAAEIILNDPEVHNLMKHTFYGNWQYLLYESMVRACTIRYLMANESDKSVAAGETAKQEKLGFLWMKELVDKLGMYEDSRNRYQNLEMFMPEIINYFKNVATAMQGK